MRRWIAAAGLAAALLAGPAAAEPSNDADLQFIGRTPEFWYFVALDPVLHTSSRAHVGVVNTAALVAT